MCPVAYSLTEEGGELSNEEQWTAFTTWYGHNSCNKIHISRNAPNQWLLALACFKKEQ